MGNIQALLQTQNNSTKLEVKGVAERRNGKNSVSMAVDRWTHGRGGRFREDDEMQIFGILNALEAKGTS